MNDLPVFEKACVETAINELLNKTYFDICTFDSIGEMIGINVQRHANYKYLRSLHCTHYANMKPEIIDNLLAVLLECLRPNILDAKALINAVNAEGYDFIPTEDAYISNVRRIA